MAARVQVWRKGRSRWRQHSWTHSHGPAVSRSTSLGLDGPGGVLAVGNRTLGWAQLLPPAPGSNLRSPLGLPSTAREARGSTWILVQIISQRPALSIVPEASRCPCPRSGFHFRGSERRTISPAFDGLIGEVGEVGENLFLDPAVVVAVGAAEEFRVVDLPVQDGLDGGDVYAGGCLHHTDLEPAIDQPNSNRISTLSIRVLLRSARTSAWCRVPSALSCWQNQREGPDSCQAWPEASPLVAGCRVLAHGRSRYEVHGAQPARPVLALGE